MQLKNRQRQGNATSTTRLYSMMTRRLSHFLQDAKFRNQELPNVAFPPISQYKILRKGFFFSSVYIVTKAKS
jgi:hypothetical protein